MHFKPNTLLRRHLRRALAPLVTVTALIAAVGVQPALAARAPGRIVTGLQVITGQSETLPCPTGLRKIGLNLNYGEGGDYVFLCEQFGTDVNRGIQELYTTTAIGYQPGCHGDDQLVDGDLNSGVKGEFISHQQVRFCIHRPNTVGGSAIEHFPGEPNKFYPVPFGKLLTDVEFVTFDPGKLPKCVNTACADTGAGALSYLEYGVTIDPYCQQTYGSDFHPLFGKWDYHGTNDLGDAVPADSGVLDLNAGRLGVTLIYACGRYTTADTIDTTPPIVFFQNNAGTYQVDQPVGITCTAEDRAGSPTEQVSGIASNTCPNPGNALAYTFGLGMHTLSATVTDGAGHSVSDTAGFTVKVTPASLCNLTNIFLGDSAQSARLCGLLSQAEQASGDMRVQLLHQFQDTLPRDPQSGVQGTFLTDAQATALLQLSQALVPSTIDDNDPSLRYSGSGWGYYAGRPAAFNDVNDDVHATTNNGDSVTLVFSGTGVSYVTELSDGYGQVDVYLDGTLVQTVDANAPGVNNRGGQALYSVSNLSRTQHVLSLAKRSGVYMLVDGFTITP